ALESGVVRVLHERSFIDDPTRLLRALRYEARLGMRMDARTEELARTAAADGALATVSGPRIRDELMDLLRELEAPSALERARELEIDSALHPSLAAEPELAAAAALGAAGAGGDRGPRRSDPPLPRRSARCPARGDGRRSACRRHTPLPGRREGPGGDAQAKARRRGGRPRRGARPGDRGRAPGGGRMSPEPAVAQFDVHGARAVFSGRVGGSSDSPY